MNQYVLRKEKRKRTELAEPRMGIAGSQPSCQHPPHGMAAAPLTLGQHILVSGQVEAWDVGWYPSKWTGQKSPAREGRGNMDTNANL